MVHVTDYIPPIRLTSSFDNPVCGLALTLKPICKCRDLAFPLYKNRAEWDEKADKSLKGIPPLAQEAIRQLQPWLDTVLPDPLTILNKLSNLDKHRACNFTLAYAHDFTFRVH